MARDAGLEELISDELRSMPDITEKAMFGGWAWLLGGNLLCGARDDGMLVRLGKGQDDWALQIKGIVPMLSRGKRMHGWVRADSSVYGDDKIRRRLIVNAIRFVGSLPVK
jgi:TfoX N-terminal domain